MSKTCKFKLKIIQTFDIGVVVHQTYQRQLSHSILRDQRW